MPLTIGLIAVVAIGIGATISQGMINKNPFEAKDLFKRGMDLPAIWIFYDTSIPSARLSADFSSRSSRALALPFLNLCYESIAKQNGSQYRIEAISGLAGLAEKLGGWDLWVAPATICLKPFGSLPNRPVFFGTDPDESFSGTAGTNVPNFQVAWSPVPNHPFWAGWEAKSKNRLDKSGGGDTARGDHKWEYIALANMNPDIEVRPMAEVGRKGASGKRIQIEDLLAAGQEGVAPFEIGPLGLYVPLPWPELRDRRAFGWFLKMSESQIAESDLVISDLFHKAGV